MSAVRPFFDTNILLYLLSDGAKADRSEQLLAQGGAVSVQVLNEIAAVCSRKLKMPWPDIREILGTVQKLCRVVPVKLETHNTGMAIAERYGLSVYDSLILAAAGHAGCDILYSEDMQDGQTVDGVTVLNPFK